MNKKDIYIGQRLYYNTNGAYNSKVTWICKVIDIGKKYIWIEVSGCLSYMNVSNKELTKEPLYKITTNSIPVY